MNTTFSFSSLVFRSGPACRALTPFFSATLAALLLLAPAARAAQSVVSWGASTSPLRSVPVALRASSPPLALGFGEHALLLQADGKVVAWGSDSHGQAKVPVGVENVVAVAAGQAHNLALRADGTVTAWGKNNAGQATVPAGLGGVVVIAAGWAHSLALKSEGTVVAWGANDSAQCNVPAGLSGVVAIAAGIDHNLALKTDGTVVAWGSNSLNKCIVPAGLNDVVAITAGESHSLALKADGTVVAWGLSSAAGLGSVPAGLGSVIAIAAGARHNLALKADGSMLAWGYNASGQAVAPAAPGRFTAISAAVSAGVALRSIAEIPPAPAMQIQPLDQSVTDQSSVMFSAWAHVPLSTGSYRWQRSTDGGATWQRSTDGAGLSGTTTAALTVNPLTAAMSGQRFRAVVRNSFGTETVSAAALLSVNFTPRLVNLSTRGLCLSGDNVLIPGFVVSGSTGSPQGGTANKRLLIRAVGPRLTDFGVSGALANPQLVLKRLVGTTFVDHASNDDWQDNTNASDIIAA